MYLYGKRREVTFFIESDRELKKWQKNKEMTLHFRLFCIFKRGVSRDESDRENN